MWKDSYAIGVPAVDKQHKKLFEMVDNLVMIVNDELYESEFKDDCRDAVVFMKSYVIMHFADEEAYQKAIGYKGFDEHKKIHQDFTEEIRNYAQKLENCDYDKSVVKEFVSILAAWLINHVTGDDQRIVR